jgi:hypothetical protein
VSSLATFAHSAIPANKAPFVQSAVAYFNGVFICQSATFFRREYTSDLLIPVFWEKTWKEFAQKKKQMMDITAGRFFMEYG